MKALIMFNKLKPILSVLFLTFFIAFIIWVVVNRESQYSDTDSYNVQLSVTGTAYSAFVTYSNSSGGTEQLSSVKLPWSKSFSCSGRNVISLVAQSHSVEGNIVATIFVNNVAIKSSQSDGSYVVASTTAIIGE